MFRELEKRWLCRNLSYRIKKKLSLSESVQAVEKMKDLINKLNEMPFMDSKPQGGFFNNEFYNMMLATSSIRQIRQFVDFMNTAYDEDEYITLAKNLLTTDYSNELISNITKLWDSFCKEKLEKAKRKRISKIVASAGEFNV